ncbi:MAG: PTS sugar transporter subunit IIA [Lachnospiraceae bacterium]
MSGLLELVIKGNFCIGVYPTWEAYMRATADRLMKAGSTRPGFDNALIQREQTYPTGLQTKTIPVSMPHADYSFVKDEMVDITIFEHPVLFHRIDCPQETVEAEIAFMLLLKGAHEQLEALKELAKVLQSPKLPELKDAKSKEEVLKIMKGMVE